MTHKIDDLLNLISAKDNDTAGSLITRENINMQNASGLSPLMVAVSARNKKMVLHLLANGADMGLKSKAGCTVWQFAGPDMQRFLTVAVEVVKKMPIKRPFVYNSYCERVLTVVYRHTATGRGRGRAD